MLEKKQKLFLALAAIFLTNALLAEIIGVKIFSAESTLGLTPAQIPLFGAHTLSFNLTAGVVLWPVVFITTDVINEYFGKKGVQRISYLTVVCIIYAFLAIYIATWLAPAEFWLGIYSKDENGQPLDIDYAYNAIFQQGMGIIIGSLVAFLIGQLLDVVIFHKLRKLTGRKMIWLRATGSTLISQLVDSFVVLFIAFNLFAPDGKAWNTAQLLSVGTINYIYKFIIAILLTPLIYLAHHLIDRYLGVEESNRLQAKAEEESEGFL